MPLTEFFSHFQLDRHVMTIVSGLCLILTMGICDWVAGDDTDNSQLVVLTGDGVPDYDDVHPDLDPDLDPELDIDDDVGDVDIDDHDIDIDDLDIDEPGYHHVWWHHYYHDGEPHLPFPLFPPTFFVHHRPHVRRGCDQWPFKCYTTYDVVQWLQCYHEILNENHPVSLVPAVVPVHAWKK